MMRMLFVALITAVLLTVTESQIVGKEITVRGKLQKTVEANGWLIASAGGFQRWRHICAPIGGNRIDWGGANMPRLRSTLDPEEQPDFIEGPTRYKVGANQSELVCGFCNETYYVDDVTFHEAMTAMEEGIDNPFCCDECEAEQEETSH